MLGARPGGEVFAGYLMAGAGAASWPRLVVLDFAHLATLTAGGALAVSEVLGLLQGCVEVRQEARPSRQLSEQLTLKFRYVVKAARGLRASEGSSSWRQTPCRSLGVGSACMNMMR